MTPRHGDRILSEWQALLKTLGQKAPIVLDGKSLDIPKLVAVARSVKEFPPPTMSLVVTHSPSSLQRLGVFIFWIILYSLRYHFTVRTENIIESRL